MPDPGYRPHRWCCTRPGWVGKLEVLDCTPERRGLRRCHSATGNRRRAYRPRRRQCSGRCPPSAYTATPSGKGSPAGSRTYRSRSYRCCRPGQDKPAGLLHVPGVCEHCALDVHCVAEGVTQVPDGAHGLVVPLQAALGDAAGAAEERAVARGGARQPVAAAVPDLDTVTRAHAACGADAAPAGLRGTLRRIGTCPPGEVARPRVGRADRGRTHRYRDAGILRVGREQVAARRVVGGRAGRRRAGLRARQVANLSEWAAARLGRKVAGL